jgi:CBS domain containing-hemolysin-like protein
MLKGGARTAADLLPVARKLLYVPATVRLEKLLQLFRERRLRFAVVVDEYGGTLGIATLENTLEALVGQIQEEFDQGQKILSVAKKMSGMSRAACRFTNWRKSPARCRATRAWPR